MGQFWDPMGLIFRCFSWIPILPCFLVNFVTNFKKTKKVKSAQNTAPVHRFRGSPGWKNSARFWKHASIFWSNFHPKLMKIQARKWEKRSSLEKSIKNRFLAPFFGPRINFWSIFGSQRGPKIAKKLRESRRNGVWGALVWKNPLKMASGSHFFKFLHQIWQWHGSKFKKTRPGGMRAALK